MAVAAKTPHDYVGFAWVRLNFQLTRAQINSLNQTKCFPLLQNEICLRMLWVHYMGVFFTWILQSLTWHYPRSADHRTLLFHPFFELLCCPGFVGPIGPIQRTLCGSKLVPTLKNLNYKSRKQLTENVRTMACSPLVFLWLYAKNLNFSGA